MKKIIFLVILAIISVFIYQKFYNQEKIFPEIIQTTTNIQMTDTLNLGILKFDTINPIKSQNEQVQQICKLIYEPLFKITKDFRVENCLAKEYSQLNETTYIIKLRENVLFHDSTYFNSNYVENTVMEIKDNKDSIYYNNVQNIKNVKVIDENTIRLELYEKQPFFEYELIFPIVKNETIGTGKYIWNNDKIISNNLYWKDIEPYITTINIKQYEDIGKMYADFKNSELDIINTKEYEYTSILGEVGFSKKEYEGREYTYLKLNNIDTAVRQAIYYAINKTEIISKIYNGNYYNVDFPLNITNWLYKNTSIQKYDIEKAIKLLEDGEWIYQGNSWIKNGTELKVNILVESTDKTKNEVAYILKNQLKKIGIIVNIEKVSKNLYNYYLKNKNYDIIINTIYIGVNPNLENFFPSEELINVINNTKDEKKLIELYQELDERYIQNLPFISLYCNKQTLIYSEKLHGSIIPNWYNIFYEIESWKKINKNS